MRATTAAAAAVLLGSAAAQDWEGWNATDSTPAAQTWSDPSSTPAAASSTNTWSSWETSTSSADPSTWSEWTSTSSTPAAASSTWTDPNWSEWSSAAASSTDPSTWSEWETTTSTDPSTWSEWTSTSTPAASTDGSWSQWSAASSADPTTTWAAWEPTATVTSTSTDWITVTVYPVDGGSTWSEWSSDKATTTTDTNTVVVQSTVTKTGTWADWSAAASSTPAAAWDPQCKLQISVSYGAPVWYPTPVLATSTSSSSSSSSSAWGTWDPSSSPAASTATTSSSWGEWDGSSSAAATSTASTWSEWDGSSTPVATSTASSSWSEWDGSSTPAAASSTASSWASWGSSASQTQGGAFYTASATSGGSWSTGAAGISSNGNMFGMTYSPYTASGGCKDQGTVAADIAVIASKGFTSVRVYSTDCSTLEFVGSACKDHGLKIILGVFISDTGISGAQPQVDAITAWAQWDIVELIVVGNEAVFNNYCSASELAGFIGSSKKSFQGAGYTGAVTTTDELSIWQSQGSAWCDVIDVVAANLYAFFNPNTVAADAGSFIQSEIQELTSICAGKEVYVMESGWPSAGNCNGVACPSPENQATAIKAIQATSGAKVVFFSFENDEWKAPGPYGVEQHWGCADVFN